MLGVDIFWLAVALFCVLIVWKGVKIVPQQQAWIVERLGKFDRNLEPGLRILVPFIERVAYKHSLKEDALDIRTQTAITKDNVSLKIDGVLYVKVIDPVASSYGVSDPYFAVTQLAQTTMRSEIGKITMDKTFEERELLNANIVDAINDAAENWGVQCLRYEIKDIDPPTTVLQAMELQVAAERKKRAEILDSEGHRQSQINIAEGHKQEAVLQSEGSKIDQINRAQGEAEAIIAVAEATAQSIERIATSIQKQGGDDAVSLKLAEQYIDAFQHLAKTNNTILLPSNVGNASNMVAEALAVFDGIRKNKPAA
jgi:regulator of protease activity HflC (stomatin/prohibitin superfamily)